VSINDFEDTDDNKWCNTEYNQWRGIWSPSDSSPTPPQDSKEIGIGTSVSSGDYGRKPYISKNYPEMMKRPTVSAIQNQLKTKYGKFEPRSEFEKPYMVDSYEEMQHYQPPPSGFTNFAWPEGSWPEFSGPVPDIGSGVVWYMIGCSLTCSPSIIRDCDKEYCCTLNPAWQPVQSVSITGPATLTTERRQIYNTGDTICFTLTAEAKQGDHVIIIVKTKPKPGQEKGGSCSGSFAIDCCDCAVEDNVAYDDTNSDETIDQGIGEEDATAVVIVTDGCGPFTWEVSGTGFSIPASTDGRTNTLSADDTACGTATITVTDNCGDSCTGYVRGTEGQWVNKKVGTVDGDEACVLTGIGTYSACGSDHCFELVEGYQKQTQRVHNYGGCQLGSSVSCCECDICCNTGGDGCTGWRCWSGISYYEPVEQYLVPYYNIYTPAENYSRKCSNIQTIYYEWEC